MATRNVVLTDHQNALIDRLVASGRYQNASEAMRAGLRLLEADERRKESLVDYIDRLIAEADDPSQILDEPGEVTIRRAFEEARARFDARSKE
ncbi:MAG: type II toxin-antitoxin system ParD family antitoxin [Pseudooceanicola sp.]|nr:type II toxin-antitoxin system ParD family antitoxin [Pseudooceanicola sp.]